MEILAWSCCRSFNSGVSILLMVLCFASECHSVGKPCAFSLGFRFSWLLSCNRHWRRTTWSPSTLLKRQTAPTMKRNGLLRLPMESRKWNSLSDVRTALCGCHQFGTVGTPYFASIQDSHGTGFAVGCLPERSRKLKELALGIIGRMKESQRLESGQGLKTCKVTIPGNLALKVSLCLTLPFAVR